MAHNKWCPVCDSGQFNYDKLDGATGLVFCGDCYRQTKNIMRINKESGPHTVSDWFRAIADARDEYMSDWFRAIADARNEYKERYPNV